MTDSLRSTLHCTEPLTRFHLTLDATAQAHTDHSAPLRDEAGQPVPVSLELTWDTDGIPYAWRTRSRYEIPCRVTGVIRIGDQEFPFAGPGQRDHSWGLRDWWANDWMWSAFHLNDGTHTHAVTVPTIPGGLVVGYVQRGDTLNEVQTVAATQTVESNGLIRDAQLVTGPTTSPSMSSHSHSAPCSSSPTTDASPTSPAPWPASGQPTDARYRMDRMEPQPTAAALNCRAHRSTPTHQRTTDIRI